MATIREVAKLAGVSTTTVSHVINKTRYVKKDTTQKVENAVHQLQYHPSSMARGLKTKSTHTIGMIVTSSTNPYFTEVVRGVQDSCFQQGYSLLLCNSDNNLEKQISYLNLLMSKRVDGLIVMEAGSSPQFYEHLQKYPDLPKLILDSSANIDASCIQDDSNYGGYLATHYLIEQGHRDIGCITGPQSNPSSRERLEGFNRAMKEANLEVNPDWLVEENFEVDGGYRAMQAFLDQHRRPSAIFAFNDVMAIGAISLAQSNGLKLPDDLSIIGYDDIELARYMSPPLTTIHQPTYQIGVEVSHLILNNVNGGRSVKKRLKLQPELAIRDTVARKKQ